MHLIGFFFMNCTTTHGSNNVKFTSPNSDNAIIFLFRRRYFTQHITANPFYATEFLILFSAERCDLHMS